MPCVHIVLVINIFKDIVTSHFRTFSEISSPTELFSKCLELCDSLAEDLQEEELKVKFNYVVHVYHYILNKSYAGIMYLTSHIE